MILYEVNLAFSDLDMEEVRSWLNEHVKKVLCVDGFQQAKIYSNSDCDNEIVVKYEVESLEKLNSYFSNEAKAMRQEGVDKFGDKMKSTRRVLVQCE